MFDINFVNWAFEPFVKMMKDVNLSSLKSDETIDLFYGDWKQIPLYMDDIMNVQHLTENEYSALSLRFELMRHMRALGFNSASYNYIGSGTSIPPHIDSDLTSGIVAFRVFIPMIPTRFKFSGKGYYRDKDGNVHQEDLIILGEEPDSDPIVFNPEEMHELEQLDENGHYLIADVFKEGVNSDGKMEYLKFALGNYF